MAIDFDLGDRCETSSSISTTLDPPVTVAGWVYMSNANYRGVMTIGNGTSDDLFGIWHHNDFDLVAFVSTGGGYKQSDTGSSKSANTWYHVAGVFAASHASRTVYVDGVAGNTESTSQTVTTPTHIGFANIYDGTPTNNFDGQQCEWGIWTVALTADEIAQLANGASPMLVRPEKLAHYYPMWDANDLSDRISGDDVDTVTGTLATGEHPGDVYYPTSIWPGEPDSPSGGVTINTNLASKTLGDQGQATGLIQALDALAKLAHAVATGPHTTLASRTKATFDAGHGIGTGLEARTKAGQGAGTGYGTVLDSLTRTGLAQIAGLVSALEARTVAESGQSTGLGTALDALTKLGHSAGVGTTPTIVTSTDSLTRAGQGAGTGHGTALDALTKLGHTAGVGAVINVATQVASLSKAGQGAALGLISALDALSITERAQALGLITSLGTESVTEFPVLTGGAGFTTNLAMLSREGLAAGVTLWQLGDAIRQAYFDLDVFFDQLGDIDVLMDSEMGWAETVSDGSNSFPGIFDDHSVAGAAPDGPRLMVRTTDRDSYDLRHGTVLTIRGRTFHVAGVRRDGTGLTTLVLNEPV